MPKTIVVVSPISGKVCSELIPPQRKIQVSWGASLPFNLSGRVLPFHILLEILVFDVPYLQLRVDHVTDGDNAL